MKCPLALVVAFAPLFAPWLSAQAEPQAASPLEFRIVAADGDTTGSSSIDLVSETERLRAWLNAGQRARVRQSPLIIEEFNALSMVEGGPLSDYVRWVPRVLRPRDDQPARWEMAYSQMPGSPVVALFAPQVYDEGQKSKSQRLVELFPINTFEEAFTAADLDPAGLEATVDGDSGRPAMRYRIAAPRIDAYRAWTEKHQSRNCAIMVGGWVRTAPVLQGPIQGAGQITGNFREPEVEALVSEVRTAVAAAAASPVDDTVVVGGDPGAIPASADPEDIRAMQGAQAMIAAEQKLRELIKAGKIDGIDRILTFEEISAWPYEDGLLGLPKGIKKLHGKTVLMTGFMLPIDEVENIQEFLLVQSLWSCCYGQPPDINGIVRVVMKGDARIDYQFEPIKVTGTFTVEATTEDGYCVDIFQLHADSVEVIN